VQIHLKLRRFLSIFEQIDFLSEEISEGVGLTASEIESVRLRIAEVTTNSMDAYNYFIRGRECQEKWYHEDARRFLEKAVQLDSTFAAAYGWLGYVNALLGDINAMNSAYDKAKTLEFRATEKERFWIDLGYAHFIEQDPQKTFSIMKHMAKKYPTEKRIHHYLGMYYRSRKLFSEAIEESIKAIELDPNYGEAINMLAYIYTDMGKYDMAIKYFNNYALVSPRDANPYDSMGELYFKMGKLDDAIAKYKAALEVKPDFGSEYRIAYIYALKKDYLEAMKWINQYIAKAKSSSRKAEGYYWKGFYYYWLGNLELSFENFLKVEKLAEEIGNVCLKASIALVKGWIYYDRGEIEQGRKHFKSYYNLRIQNHPTYTPLYKTEYTFYMGLMDLERGRIDSTKSRLAEMKDILSEINLRWKDQITFYYNLLYAEVLCAEDSLEKAIVVCKKTSLFEISMVDSDFMLSYNIPFIMDVLARIYLKEEELDKAIAEYERLITFDPKSKDRRLIYPIYHYRLAKLYDQTGQSEKAIKEYEKFLEIWKDADKDLPELIDSQKRLAKLKE